MVKRRQGRGWTWRVLSVCGALLWAQAVCAEGAPEGDAGAGAEAKAEAKADAATCTLHDPLFDVDQTQLSQAFMPLIDGNVACWRAHSEARGEPLRVLIVGHADASACPDGCPEDYLVEVTHQYAKSVKKELIKRGVNEALIEVDAKGGYEPAFVVDGIARDMRNRRVELSLLDPKTGEVVLAGQRTGGPICEPEDIHFDFKKEAPGKDMASALEMNARCFKELAKRSPTPLKLSVIGHTDETVEPKKALALGQKRADAVKAQLVKAGVDVALIETGSAGNAEPVVACGCKEERNHRVKLEVVPR
jgi:outer membrane protein OmpA-like peptidoglycan-associated protein